MPKDARKLMETWIDNPASTRWRQPVGDVLTDRIDYSYQRMTFQNSPSNRKPKTKDLYPVTLTLSDVWPLRTRTLGWKPDEGVNNKISAHVLEVNDFRFCWAIIDSGACKVVYIWWQENTHVSRKPQYKDVYRRTIEILQRPHIFKINCCLKVHNAHLKLASPISGIRSLQLFY